MYANRDSQVLQSHNHIIDGSLADARITELFVPVISKSYPIPAFVEARCVCCGLAVHAPATCAMMETWHTEAYPPAKIASSVAVSPLHSSGASSPGHSLNAISSALNFSSFGTPRSVLDTTASPSPTPAGLDRRIGHLNDPRKDLKTMMTSLVAAFPLSHSSGAAAAAGSYGGITGGGGGGGAVSAPATLIGAQAPLSNKAAHELFLYAYDAAMRSFDDAMMSLSRLRRDEYGQSGLLRAKADCMYTFAAAFSFLAHSHIVMHYSTLANTSDGSGSMNGFELSRHDSDSSQARGNQAGGVEPTCLHARLQYTRSSLWELCSSAGAQTLLRALSATIPSYVDHSSRHMLDKLRLLMASFTALPPIYMLPILSSRSFRTSIPRSLAVAHAAGKANEGKVWNLQGCMGDRVLIDSACNQDRDTLAGFARPGTLLHEPTSELTMWTRSADGLSDLGAEALAVAATDLHRFCVHVQQRSHLISQSMKLASASVSLFPGAHALSDGESLSSDKSRPGYDGICTAGICGLEAATGLAGSVFELVSIAKVLMSKICELSKRLASGWIEPCRHGTQQPSSALSHSFVLRGVCADVLDLMFTFCGDEGLVLVASSALQSIVCSPIASTCGLFDPIANTAGLQAITDALKSHTTHEEIVLGLVSTLLPLTRHFNQHGGSISPDLSITLGLTLVECLRTHGSSPRLCHHSLQVITRLCIGNRTLRLSIARTNFCYMLVQLARAHSESLHVSLVVLSTCATLTADYVLCSECCTAGLCEWICDLWLYRLEKVEISSSTELVGIASCWALCSFLQEPDGRMHARFVNARGADLVIRTLSLSLSTHSDGLRIVALTLLVLCARVNYCGMNDRLITMDGVILLYDAVRYVEAHPRLRPAMQPLIGAALSLLRPTVTSS